MNVSKSTCLLHGWPGVSLVKHGAQLGGAAQWEELTDASGNPRPAPSVSLLPGESAQSTLGVSNARNYGSRCKLVTADGFRVYPPNSYTAVFVPAQEQACDNKDIDLLVVYPVLPKP